MRVVAITKALDEADIIEAFVRHTAAFVSHHIILDNGSRDETAAILRQLSEEGLPITVFSGSSVSFDEKRYNTFLYRYAAETFDPDWVLCLDADEFVDDRRCADGLLSALATLDMSRTPSLVSIPMTNYHPCVDDDTGELIVPRRLIHRTPVTGVCKVAVSGRLDASRVVVENGGHEARLDGELVPESAIPGLTLAHFPERSAAQRILKYMRGWIKVLAAGPAEIARGTSYHYAGFWKALHDHPRELLSASSAHASPTTMPGLVADPIDYRGAGLTYTPKIDAEARTAALMIDYVEDLARRYGEVIEAVPGARDFADRQALSIHEIVPGTRIADVGRYLPDLIRTPTRPAGLVRRRLFWPFAWPKSSQDPT